MAIKGAIIRYKADIAKAILVTVLIAGWVHYLDVREERMANRELRHKTEWPVILSVASKEGLSQEDMVMLLAIRDAENGAAGMEFGAMDVPNTDLMTQATSAARSLRNNRRRYDKYVQEGAYKGSRRTTTLKEDEKPMDFIEFMGYYGSPTGYGYAPIHSPELKEVKDSHIKVNTNWSSNVRKLTAQYQKQFQDRGINEKTP